MNNDIKEILDEMINLNDYEYYKIYGKRVNEIGQLLLDYITNLQEENERLNNIIEEKKIPEKLNLDIDELRGKETPRAIDYLIEGKINEVLDYLKSKGDE